jgi:type IV secretory pathway VirB10-like protein
VPTSESPSKNGLTPQRIRSTLKIPKLNTLLQKSEEKKSETVEEAAPTANRPFTVEQVKQAWNEFADTRKKYRAEYQLLTQEIELQETSVIVHLHNPVQETLLNGLKTDITAFIRARVENHSIQVNGVLQQNDDKKVIYTNREKFDHLAEKNPNLKILKEKLGLDPDF